MDLGDNSVGTLEIQGGAVTNSKLAHGAIPEAWHESGGEIHCSSSDFAPIPDDWGGTMTVDIWVERDSTLVIMFHSDCYVSKPDYSWMGALMVKAMVDGTESSPGGQFIAEDGDWQSGSAMWRYGAPVGPGSHTVTIEWAFLYAADPSEFGSLLHRSLWVMALP